jgi:hypothetical protein
MGMVLRLKYFTGTDTAHVVLRDQDDYPQPLGGRMTTLVLSNDQKWF